MQVLRHASEVSAFIQPQPETEISTLIHQRLADLLVDDEAMEDLVFFVIVESTDTLADLEATLGTPLYGTEGRPLWEVIEAHITCFELVFVLQSSGYGALVFLPHLDAHPELLALCRSHSVQMQEPLMP